MSQKTTVEELREKLRPINELLADAHPGLVTWKLALAKSLGDFCRWWMGPEVKP